MLSRCAGCGREYDLSQYPPGYSGTCLCGSTVVRASESGDPSAGPEDPHPTATPAGPGAALPGAASLAGAGAKTSGLAIASMVIGIISLPLFVLWIPLGPIALGLGIAGLISTSQRPDRTGGGMAVAGIVTAGVSLLIFIVFVFGTMVAAIESAEALAPLDLDPDTLAPFDVPLDEMAPAEPGDRPDRHEALPGGGPPTAPPQDGSDLVH